MSALNNSSKRSSVAFILFILLLIALFASKAKAQNVGIGTNSPQAKLDVKGNFRAGGTNKYLSYDSSTGQYTWSNSFIWAPSPLYLMMHSASAEGLYYGNSQLEYRNSSGNPVFFTNWSNGSGYFNGSLGIGTLTPASKLHIQDGNTGILPNFANLILERNAGHNYMSFFTSDNYESAMLFYTPSQSLVASGGIFYNSNLLPYGFIFRTNSSPRMYLNNNGDLGIGTNPSAKLHVGSGTVRIDGPAVPGGNALSLGGYGDLQVDAFGSPGGRFVVKENGNVGIGNPAPGFLLSFPNSLGDKISLWGSSGSHYGFGIQSNLLQIHADGVTSDIAFGYGASGSFIERFRMKNNGAFVVNGNAGTVGQVLKSNGSTAPPSWTSSTNSLYNNMVQVFATDSVGITASNTWIPIPGMTYSFVTSGNAKVIAMFNVQVFPGFCFSCNATTASIGVFMDGSLGRFWTADVFNSASQNISGSYLMQVGPGSHTINIRGKKIGSPAYFAFAIAGTDIGNNMVLQIIPE